VNIFTAVRNSDHKMWPVLIYLCSHLFPYTALSRDHVWWLHRCHSLKLFHVFSWHVHHWCCSGVPCTVWSLHYGLLYMRGFTSYECPYLHTYVLTYMWSFLVLCLSLTCFGWSFVRPPPLCNIHKPSPSLTKTIKWSSGTLPTSTSILNVTWWCSG
jgi:hypothetical protein